MKKNDVFKEIVEKANAGKPPKRIPKTFYLTEDNLEKFEHLVERLEGEPTQSSIVDKLIEAFIESQKGGGRR